MKRYLKGEKKSIRMTTDQELLESILVALKTGSPLYNTSCEWLGNSLLCPIRVIIKLTLKLGKIDKKLMTLTNLSDM